MTCPCDRPISATFGADVVLHRPSRDAFLDDMFYVSGEIPRVTPFERGLPGQVRRTEDGNGWEPDELLMDERWLAVNVADKGLVVLQRLLACRHRQCAAARARDLPDAPIHAVMGGLHLSGANEAVIPQTVRGDARVRPQAIAAGHCTGWRADRRPVGCLRRQSAGAERGGKRYSFKRDRDSGRRGAANPESRNGF